MKSGLVNFEAMVWSGLCDIKNTLSNQSMIPKLQQQLLFGVGGSTSFGTYGFWVCSNGEDGRGVCVVATNAGAPCQRDESWRASCSLPSLQLRQYCFFIIFCLSNFWRIQICAKHNWTLTVLDLDFRTFKWIKALYTEEGTALWTLPYDVLSKIQVHSIWVQNFICCGYLHTIWTFTLMGSISVANPHFKEPTYTQLPSLLFRFMCSSSPKVVFLKLWFLAVDILYYLDIVWINYEFLKFE